MTVQEVLESWNGSAIPKDELEREAHKIVKNALNKQIPKRVNHFLEDDTFETTCCGIDVTNEDYKYCPECGQLLGEVEEIDN